MKPVKCANCGKVEGKHLASNKACPFGRSRNFPSYRTDKFFTPKTRTLKGQ